MKRNDVKSLADAVLMQSLQNAGFVSTDVEAKPDNDGEESLFLTLHFKPGAELASGLAYLDAQVAVREALKKEGDARFPYFSFDYPDDPAPFDAEEVFGSQ